MRLGVEYYKNIGIWWIPHLKHDDRSKQSYANSHYRQHRMSWFKFDRRWFMKGHTILTIDNLLQQTGSAFVDTGIKVVCGTITDKVLIDAIFENLNQSCCPLCRHIRIHKLGRRHGN